MRQSPKSWISALANRLANCDAAVVIGAWLIVVWSAVTSWAQHAVFGLASDAPIIVNQLLLTAHSVIIITVALVPVAVFLTWKRGLPPSIVRFATSLQGTTAAFVLLDALTLLMLYHAYAPPSRLRTFVAFASGLILALLLVWLFYRRYVADWRGSLLGGLWLLLFGFALMTERWWWRDDVIPAAYRVGYTMLIALLAVMPFILTVPRIREALRPALRTLNGLPLDALAVVVWVPIAIRILMGIARIDDPTPLTHSLTLIEALIVGLLMLRIYGGNASEQKPLPAHIYRVGLTLCIGLYFIIGVVLIPAWIGAVSQDGFTYLNTARNYAMGHFVVRGLWSPLMSWLMAPFVALGGHPQVVQRAGVVLNGLIWMLLSGILAERFKLKPMFRLCVMVAMAAFSLRYSFWPLTPDPLAAMILTAYFVVILSDRALSRPIRLGLAVGALGALAYFAKYFNVGFIPMHLVVSAALFWLNGAGAARAAKFLAAAFAAFLLIIAPWVVLISLRYDMPTASVAGLLNRANLNPERSQQIDNCVTNPFCPHPDDVLFPWEDPDPAVYMPYAWSPFDNLESFQRAIWITSSSLWYFAQEQALEAGGMIPLALILLALSTFAVWGNADKRTLYLWLIATVALYILGHATTNAGEFRYFYALIPLGFIAVYTWIQSALEHLAAAPVSARGALMLRAALLAAPIVLTTTRPSGYVPLIGLRNPADRCQEFDAQAIKPHLRAPMASNSGSIHALSYYTQVRTYGAASGSAAEIDAVIREAGVRSYVIRSESNLATSLVNDFGYLQAAELTYCDEQFTILHLP